MSTRFRNTLAVFVLTGSLALAGCGSDSKEAKETSTPGTSTSQQAQGETTSAAPDPKTSTAPDPKTSAAQGTTVPDGYKEVTAPTAKITFAVPQDWENLGELSDSQLEELASNVDQSVDQIKTLLAQLDLFVMAQAPDEAGITPNLNVAKQTVPTSVVPDQKTVESLLQKQNATLDSYETVETANGQGVRSAYTLTQAGKTIKGVMLILPNAQKAFTVIYISGSTAEEVKGFADVVVQTAH